MKALAWLVIIVGLFVLALVAWPLALLLLLVLCIVTVSKSK